MLERKLIFDCAFLNILYVIEPKGVFQCWKTMLMASYMVPIYIYMHSHLHKVVSIHKKEISFALYEANDHGVQKLLSKTVYMPL